MALTSVGAIYATGSLLLQRIYIPQLDDIEIDQQYVAAGETLVKLPLATFDEGQAAVQAAIGTPSFSGRCAVVNSSNVVIALIVADPAIYTDPNGNQVIAHDQANIGDTWNGSVFENTFLEVSPTTAKVVAVTTHNIMSPTPVTAGDLMVEYPGGTAALIGMVCPVQSQAISKILAAAEVV
jgi:hypothetical protein